MANSNIFGKILSFTDENTYKTKASQIFGNDDFHAWIETPEGTILDYDNKSTEFVKIRRLHNLTDERVYNPFPEDEERKAFLYLHNKFIKPRLKLMNELSKEWQKKYEIMVMNIPGQCIMRASFIWKNNKGYKIRIGSMGWKNKRGGVWWEYG